MTLVTLLILVAFSIFSVYNIYVLSVFGVPSNLCVTYYHFGTKHRKLGVLFPLLMMVQCCLLFPTWLRINSELPESSETMYVWFVYVTIASILTVTLLTQYKKSRLRTFLHYGAAILAAGTSLLWMFLASPWLWYIPFLALSFVAAAALFTGTWKSCILYWLELADFYSVFVTLFILSLTL